MEHEMLNEQEQIGDRPLVLTVDEVAEMLGVDRKTAYDAVHLGQIPSLRFGRILRVPTHALDALLAGDIVEQLKQREAEQLAKEDAERMQEIERRAKEKAERIAERMRSRLEIEIGGLRGKIAVMQQQLAEKEQRLEASKQSS